MAYQIMRCSTIKENIWRCRIKPSDVNSLKIKEDFWKDTLASWSKYNYYRNFRIENQYLWYNSDITIKGKSFLWKDAEQKGLEYVHQLFQELKFKEDKQLIEQYGLTKLRINSLKAAIPQDWKRFFTSTHKQQYMPLPPHNYDTSLKDKKISQKVYQYLQDDVMIIHNKYMAWRKEIGPDFCDGLVEFGNLHKDIYALTNVPKYRSFQYRLLQRGLVTNIQLAKWGMRDSDICSFCEEHHETVTHLFAKCRVISPLWKQLITDITKRYGEIPLVTNNQNIILNKISQKKHVATFMCLLTKQYIYKQRCLVQYISTM